MTADKYCSDDELSKPPDETVLLKKKGSWKILYSPKEQSIYIVPIDYHPEPLQLHKTEFQELMKMMQNIATSNRRKNRTAVKNIKK
jgi:hypothetical protein